jgi:hypothetical protein
MNYPDQMWILTILREASLNVRRIFSLALFAGLCGASLQATTITADLVRAEVSPNSVTTALPFLMNGPNNAIFLKFMIPNFDQILTINTFEIDLTLFDNADGGGETGEIQFAQPGTNLELAIFGPNLNHTTQAFPAVFQIPLCSCQISQVFPSLQDGTFRIKILRDSGDFFLGGGTATLDVTLAPEPSMLFGTAVGLLAMAGFQLRRARRNSLLKF